MNTKKSTVKKRTSTTRTPPARSTGNITVAFRTSNAMQKAIGIYARKKDLRKSQVINMALAKALKVRDSAVIR